MGTSFRSTLTTCTSIGRGAASAGLFERLTKIRKARAKAAATATVGIRTLRLARIVFSWVRMIVSVLACYHSFPFTAANRRVELPRPPCSDRISLKAAARRRHFRRSTSATQPLTVLPSPRSCCRFVFSNRVSSIGSLGQSTSPHSRNPFANVGGAVSKFDSAGLRNVKRPDGFKAHHRDLYEI